MSFYSPIEGGFEIQVLAVPGSSRSRIAGVQEGCLRVQLAAPPADGEANDALVDLLAELLDLRKRNVTIVSGHGSRRKRVQVVGVSEDRVLALVPSAS